MGQKPDREYITEWCGHNVVVREYCEPTQDTWDGDEPLPEGSEGWDLAVHVELTWNGQTFKAHDAVCNHWILPNLEGRKYLSEQLDSIREEAFHSLTEEIKKVASGEQLLRAVERQQVAFTLIHGYIERPERPMDEGVDINTFHERTLKLFPKATVDKDGQGQIVVYTDFGDTENGVVSMDKVFAMRDRKPKKRVRS